MDDVTKALIRARVRKAFAPNWPLMITTQRQLHAEMKKQGPEVMSMFQATQIAAISSFASAMFGKDEARAAILGIFDQVAEGEDAVRALAAEADAKNNVKIN